MEPAGNHEGTTTSHQEPKGITQPDDERPVILDEILGALDDGVHELPVQAILDARQHRAAIIPSLIEVLGETAEAAIEGELPAGNAHFFALFLLAEFQAKEALPAVLATLAIPEDELFELYGDAITENLASILVALLGEDFHPLDTLISNPHLSYYVRSQAVRACLILVREGRLTRDAAVQRLGQHLRDGLLANDVDLIASLVFDLATLAPRELRPEIEEVYALRTVDEGLVDRQYIDERLNWDEEQISAALRQLPEAGIKDTIAELRDWAQWSAEDDEYADEEFPEDEASETEEDISGFDLSSWGGFDRTEDWKTLEAEASASDSDTVRSNFQRHSRVGRNEPCPCGSGKKYKKCCGRAGQQTQDGPS